MKKTLLQMAGIGLIGLGILVIPSTLLVLSILPEHYQSIARVQISAPLEMPDWVQTEAEVIQSKLVLGKVIERLNLDEVWAKKYKDAGKLSKDVAFLILKSTLEVRPTRGTRLLQIRVVNEQAGEAAQIANAIARVYAEIALAKAKQSARPGQRVETPVEIIDLAEPAPRPIAAKGTKITVAVLVSLFLVASGGVLILLAIWRPPIRPPMAG